MAEGHTQAHGPLDLLLQLAGQLPIHHVELAEGVAWGEGHERGDLRDQQGESERGGF